METVMKDLKETAKEAAAYYAIVAWDFIRAFARRYASQILCLAIGFLLAIVMLRGQTAKTEAAVRAEYEQQRIEAEETAAQEAERTATEGQKTTLYRNVARALYGIRQYNLSPDAKRAYIQVMLNRANPEIQYDVMAGTDDLASVLAVPNQWQGYNPEGNYNEEDFRIVKEFLESGSGNVLDSDRYFWAEIRQGYIICKTDIGGSGRNYKEQVVQ